MRAMTQAHPQSCRCAKCRQATPVTFAVEPFTSFGAETAEFSLVETEWADELEAEMGRRRFAPQRRMQSRVRPTPRPRRRSLRRRWPGRGRWGPPVFAVEPRVIEAPPSASQGNEHIRWVQNTLNQVMNLHLPVDGVMSVETRSAIRSFQEKQSLPVDGIVGPETEKALRAAQSKPPEPDDAAAPTEEFNFEWEEEVNRSTTAYIRWVQQALNQIMGLRLAVDGIVGPLTRSAIRSFQQKYGLLVDGIVGPQTESALITAGATPSFSALAGGGVAPQPQPARTMVQPFVVLDRFAFNSTTLPSQHNAIVECIGRLIVASRRSGQPITTVRLVGHTDKAGSLDVNVNFGERRAQEVRGKLLEAIRDLGSVPAGTLTIVLETRGETQPVASNNTSTGQARNRRVEVFLPVTCQSFLAQYDLRFMPDDPIFGIPAHPNLTDTEKVRRSNDVLGMVAELERRRAGRAADALVGRVPTFAPLPIDPAPDSLRSIATRLSKGQLDLYREFFADGAGDIDFAGLQRCFEQFANGELRSPLGEEQASGVGEPNSDFFFLFAEFAFLCIDSSIAAAEWTKALRVFVAAQEIFMHVYRPAAVSPPPSVNAALPSCPTDAQGRLRTRQNLGDYDNGNFRPSSLAHNIGAGQSNQARKQALRTKYAALGLAALKEAARANMVRAQCMP